MLELSQEVSMTQTGGDAQSHEISPVDRDALQRRFAQLHEAALSQANPEQATEAIGILMSLLEPAGGSRNDESSLQSLPTSTETKHTVKSSEPSQLPSWDETALSPQLAGEPLRYDFPFSDVLPLQVRTMYDTAPVPEHSLEPQGYGLPSSGISLDSLAALRQQVKQLHEEVIRTGIHTSDALLQQLPQLRDMSSSMDRLIVPNLQVPDFHSSLEKSQQAFDKLTAQAAEAKASYADDYDYSADTNVEPWRNSLESKPGEGSLSEDADVVSPTSMNASATESSTTRNPANMRVRWGKVATVTRPASTANETEVIALRVPSAPRPKPKKLVSL
eukprot:TRINITY_DN26828_c0_g1_i1.p1 TRINITY_DN26828_c0_g1~~TRINITY_DN26828_c0_g1_i1.p1  ORF type:complete len:332 (+),score=53.72 TRINITY_DN26828_c0_g1_i1:63-1058(+)